MKLRILIVLALVCPAFPAMACSPPSPLPMLSDADVASLTASAIKDSDVIVDAIVAHKGETLFLKPIKVWKGKYQRSYELGYDCVQPLMIGGKVRVMLIAAEGFPTSWSVIKPILDRRNRAKLFNDILDAHIGQVRPPDYGNGSLPYPPMP